MSYEAVIVYGFNEGTEEACLDEQWLSQNFPNVKIFSTYAGEDPESYYEKIYGIECDFDNGTGVVTISPENKEMVETLYDCFETYHASNEDRDTSILAYYQAIKYDNLALLLDNPVLLTYDLEEQPNDDEEYNDSDTESSSSSEEDDDNDYDCESISGKSLESDFQ